VGSRVPSRVNTGPGLFYGRGGGPSSTPQSVLAEVDDERW